MGRYLNWLPPIIIAALSPAAAVSQTSPPTSSERIEAFIEGRAQDQRLKASRIGPAAELAGLNGLVRAVNLRLPNPAFVDDPKQKQRLGDAFLTDVAQELAALGFKPGDVRAASGNGQELVEAAAARVRGTASLRQHGMLADTLVIGKVSALNEQDDRGDGFLSTVSVTVERSLSKGVAAGETVELRRRTGQTATKRIASSVEAPLAVGETILLVGSRALYSSLGTGRGQGKGAVAELVPFYRVSGESLTPSGPFQQPATTGELPSQM